jgi:hypothetical protein
MKRFGAMLLGVVLALTLGADAATVGGMPSRPRLQQATIAEASPQLRWTETDAGADTGIWKCRANAGIFICATNLDTDAEAERWLQVTRTAGVVGSVAIPNGILVAQDNFLIANNNPIFELEESDGGLDDKNWVIDAAGEQLRMRTITDADTLGANFLTVDRTDTAIDAVNILGTAVTINGVNAATRTTGTATLTAVGLTTAPTVTMKYSIVGTMACLMVPGLTGTSNSTSFSMSGLPAAVQMPNDGGGSYVAIAVTNATNNSVAGTARARIAEADGSINFEFLTGGTYTLTGWTAANVKTIQDFSICYSIA